MKNCFIDSWLLTKIIRESPYALLYPRNNEEDKLGLPIVVKANESVSPRFLNCVAEDATLLKTLNGHFPVVLRFINKKRGNFIRIEALARITESNGEAACMSVEISHIAWVYTKTGLVEFYI
jgi:hypothetical protein